MTKKQKDAFAKRMFSRMNAAYKRMEAIDATVQQAVPVLQKAVSGNKKEIEALEAVLNAMRQYQSEFGAVAGHLTETGIEARGLLNEYANLTTYINATRVYAAAEPATVLITLNEFHLPVLEDQLVELEEKRYIELKNVMARAEARRYSQRLDIENERE